MLQPFLEAGRIVGTHGVKGELRIEPWCDSADFLSKFRTLYWDSNGASSVQVLSSRVHKRLLLAYLEGVTSATQGDSMRGRVLYLRRADVKLPEGTWFVQDMIGLTVLDYDSGKEYGKLTDILKTGANDVYEITALDGKTYLLPSIPQVVLVRDPEAGVMKIRPIKGIFDDED